jgi:hypothetical protein
VTGGPGEAQTVDVTGNPNVLWGYGSKFSKATPIRGLDGTGEYLYFLGSGELQPDIDLPLEPSEPVVTGQIYLARVEASADRVADGQFTYYAGTVDGWDPDEAKAVAVLGLRGWNASVSSVTKHGDNYYMAVAVTAQWLHEWSTRRLSWHPRRGMLVFRSADGCTWSDGHFVPYTDLSDLYDVTTTFFDWMPQQVYGHYWIPDSVFSEPDGIAYTFSVWKSYWGFFYDRWFVEGPSYVIDENARFRNYNTKMYWYFVH